MMRLQPEDLISIAERSAFLYERLGPDFVLYKSLEERETARDRLQRWCTQASRGNQQRFQKRLTWDGINPAFAEALVSGVRLRDSRRLPRWTPNLEMAIVAAANLAGATTREIESQTPYLDPSAPVAFEHLLVPFVESASRQLEELLTSPVKAASDPRLLGLQRYLLKVLSKAAERTFEVEFCAWREIPGTKEFVWAMRHEPARPLYGAFLHRMWHGGLRDLLCEYPVLARWLAAACQDWTEFAQEFIAHLEQDKPELATTFNDGKPWGEVTGVEAGVSDRHEHGRTVLRVSFGGGSQLYYKPRSLESDRAYNRLLEWLNDNGSPLDLRTVRVLNRSQYGWCESIPAAPCADSFEVGQYYQRAGMLLCLLYVLQGNDCSFHNLVAHGEYPVVIDSETLAQPRPVAAALTLQSGVSAAGYLHFSCDSVFRTGLLPRWTPSGVSQGFDASGLGTVDGNRGTWAVRLWHNVNTDSMRMQWHDVTPMVKGHEPFLSSKTIGPGNYSEEICHGFCEMYKFLSSRRKELWSPEGPLQAFFRVPVRFLFRNSDIYARLLDRCALPDQLRNGIDTSICMDVLARCFLSAENKPREWTILAAEHNTLAQMEIPRFTTTSDSRMLDAGNAHLVHGLFSVSGFSQILSRLELLSPSDLKLQMQYIRASLHWNSVQDPRQPDRVSSSGEGRFLRTALAIAENISHSAIRSDEGEAGWVAQAQEITAHSCQFQPMRRDLYDGTCGVALFLAALQSVAGINKYGELARAALKPVLRVSTDQMRYWAQGDKLGAGLGSPSVIYSLVKISGLLKDESLLDFAFNVASLIDQRQITADGRYDLLGGISGCLVAFRALYQKKKHPWILNTIRTCADHLLTKRMAMPQGHLSWAASDGRFLSGFAHGTSGISFALRQAYAILEDERYLRAANESGEASNGRDGSPPDRSDLSWCHGETGVLFGELETRSVYHSRSEEAVQHGKLEQIASRPLDLLDFPCCGNMGRVDLLLEAGRRLSQPRFHDQASSLADRILTRVNHHARWGLGSRDSFHSPSFHQGMAGIGYTLLRLEQPNLPAILCWE